MPLLFGTVLLLPFLIADTIRGGDGLGSCLLVLFYVGGTAQTLVGFGLLCSLVFRRTQTAIAAALLSAVGICVGTFIAWGVIASMMPQQQANLPPLLAGLEFNPFYVLYNLMTLLPAEDLLSPPDAQYAFGIVSANVAVQVGVLIFILLALSRGIRRPSAQ
jgi:hypothetical protein